MTALNAVNHNAHSGTHTPGIGADASVTAGTAYQTVARCIRSRARSGMHRTARWIALMIMYPSHDDCERDLDRCLPTWPMRAIDGEHTPSDLQWCGIVDEPLPQWLRGPRRDMAKDNPGWQRMIARAKADIDAIDGEWRLKRLAAACTPADVKAFVEALG